MSAGTILVIDVGTSSVRASLVDGDATVRDVRQLAVPAATPAPGLVEFDALKIRDAILESAQAALAVAGEVAAVGITNQRATTVVWDATTGLPIGPAIGWQDLRTVVACLLLQSEGLRLAPNASATKLQWLLETFDPVGRQRDDLRFGTIDTWAAWILSEGSLHVTDASNAGVTGLFNVETESWDPRTLELLGIDSAMLPQLVDSTGVLGEASALDGAPPIAGLAGDQQASLIGQGCTAPGLAKITFGTGGMLDLVTGAAPPQDAQRGPAGTFPIAAWRRSEKITWGLEAVMLSAGSCVEWLCEDLGILESPASSEEMANRCEQTDGVTFVPALLGLGTPTWDFGARGLLLGLTRGSGRPQITRAVLEGVAQRGRDLVEAAEADAGLEIASVRIDGGMSANSVFVAALADALDRPVELSPVLEATTLGAGYLAGMAVGLWRDEADVSAAWAPRAIIEPTAPPARREENRARFVEARHRAERTLPDLSGISF